MSSKVPLVVGNWKMNKNCDESVLASEELLHGVSKVVKVKIILAPAFPSLFVVKNILRGANIILAAQDVFYENSGPFTGEVSADMIKNIGCSYVIIGHSERRKFFYETNRIINKKVFTSLKAGIFPILCVGENKVERKKGLTFLVIKQQLEENLKNINEDDISRVTFAYEPVWAIGTGQSATELQAQEVHSFIRSCLKKMYSYDLAYSVRIIYGGSVTSKNVKRLIFSSDIDGVLVGGASLDSKIFSELIHLVDVSTTKL